MHWDWGYGWGMTGWGGFMMIVFWLLVIVGAVLLVRALAGSSRPSSPEETPLDIVRKRYARGEITKAEYEEKLKDLG